MPLATLVAAMLTLVGTAAAVHGYRDNRLTALISAGLGAVMLGMLLVPGVTGTYAAALSLALLLPLGGVLAVPRLRGRVGPRGSRHRLVLALTLADIEFMAVAMFLMPPHEAIRPASAAAHMGGMPGMGGMAPGVAEVMAAVLIGWAACAAALIVPLARGKGRHGAWHAVCSGTMITAMAVVSL
ncbi:MAG: hypothetical protein EPN48_17170 [Microbacteriaceae bacterium]|nr:MAG: hypothetical protein EPN48_17170 [Microbacteriaceae bacterium]